LYPNNNFPSIPATGVIAAPDHPDADGPIVQVFPTAGREELRPVVAVRPWGNRPDEEVRFDQGEGRSHVPRSRLGGANPDA
jgi:hypothetical protein